MSLNIQKHIRLEKEYVQKINQILKSKNLQKRNILEEALFEFNTMLSKNKSYRVKFSEFDRVKLINYSLYLLVEQHQEVTELANKLNLSRPILLREVIVSYLINKKA